MGRVDESVLIEKVAELSLPFTVMSLSGILIILAAESLEEVKDFNLLILRSIFHQLCKTYLRQSIRICYQNNNFINNFIKFDDCEN